MKKNTPNITYALVPTSDIQRIALIDESRQKLEAILTAFPIKETLNFCFGGIGSLGVCTYNSDEFKKLSPDNDYKLILRVSPAQDGYTALQVVEKAPPQSRCPRCKRTVQEICAEEFMSIMENISPILFDYGKPYVKRHFDNIDKEFKDLLNMIGIPVDHPCSEKSNKPKTTEISEDDASSAHQLSSDLNKQMDDVADQILSKLHAILEIQGINNVFKSPTGKIMFNVEISRINDILRNVVHSVVEID